MLFNNNMRPAYATASSSGYAKGDASKENRFAFFSEADSDDFGDFNASQTQARGSASAGSKKAQQAPKQKKPKQSKKNFNFSLSNLPLKQILIGVGALAAVILLIILMVAIFSAPQKQIKLEDNAYFVYSDTEGMYHVVSNGKELKHEFEGAVTVTPSKDHSFAYVFEDLSASESGSGQRIYILKGTKLKDIEVKADSIVALSDFEPGIIYKKNSRYHYYSSDDHTPITSDASAEHFAISDDGSTVIYTIDSSKEPGSTDLKYFKNGGSETIGPRNFVPVELSSDGKYVYGINEVSGTLYYLTVKKGEAEIKPVTNASNGIFGDITGMNVDGDEIVFYTESEKGITSFLYRVGDDAPVQIAEGLFTPINADKSIVCPDTFVNSYFICEKDITDEDGVTTSATLTYFYDRSDGARKLANATGQFSPDCKYFYYVNEDSNLVRISLDSKDFQDSEKPVISDVVDFAVVAKGDVYVMINDVMFGMIYHWDASTAKRTIISSDAKLGSMQLAANSIYFTEEINDEVKVYVSTEGSSKTEANFKNAALTGTPEMKMGSGEKGYAYFTDENGNTMLFYSANGEKFSLVSKSCVIDGITPPPAQTDKPSSEEQ